MRSITRYSCGHVGKSTGKKISAFIRVAELRGETPEESPKKCPECVARLSK